MNTLIKSVIDQKSKAIFKTLIPILFIISVLMIIPLSQERDYGYFSYPGFATAFKGDGEALALLIIAIASFVAATALSIVFWIHNKCTLTVTEKDVRGKTLFGKEVVLPIYMISAYSTRSFMSTIGIATSSGLVKFAFIENYAEIGAVLSKLIANRQSETVNTQANSNNSSNMDDLVKLKSLLDSGIITQEEFEAKKKQLLGL